MKKRLRKKKFLGEFAVYGFSCTFRFVPPLGGEAYRQFVGEFTALLTGSGLVVDGDGGPTEWQGVIRHGARHRSATQAHREAVSAWLSSRPEVRNVSISRLADLHYGLLKYA